MYTSPAITGQYNGEMGRKWGYRRYLGEFNSRTYLVEIIQQERLCGMRRKECLDYLLWLRWMGCYPIKRK